MPAVARRDFLPHQPAPSAFPSSCAACLLAAVTSAICFLKAQLLDPPSLTPRAAGEKTQTCAGNTRPWTRPWLLLNQLCSLPLVALTSLRWPGPNLSRSGVTALLPPPSPRQRVPTSSEHVTWDCGVLPRSRAPLPLAQTPLSSSSSKLHPLSPLGSSTSFLWSQTELSLLDSLGFTAPAGSVLPFILSTNILCVRRLWTRHFHLMQRFFLKKSNILAFN